MARGVTVVGCVRKMHEADTSADLWKAPSRIYEACVTDEAAMAAFARGACADGPPDIVIANAGIISERAPSWTIPVDIWRDMMDVNVIGVVQTLRAFMPALIERGSGLFIAMSSGWGREATQGLAPYCASKFAVEGLIGSLQCELPEEVRAVALDPGGGVNTSMLASCLPEENAAYPAPSSWGVHAAQFIAGTVFAAHARGSLTVPPVPSTREDQGG